MTLILKCNNFVHGKDYLQVQNTAMGTKPTCIRHHIHGSYATIFMGRLEGQLLRSVTLRLFSWLRFIDHIDMKWSHGRDTLTTFLDEANNFHSSIKFTAEISKEQHMFLDTKSRLVGNTVSVDLYTKSSRYTPVSLTHKLPPDTLLQICSLQPCTTYQTYLLRFRHF